MLPGAFVSSWQPLRKSLCCQPCVRNLRHAVLQHPNSPNQQSAVSIVRHLPKILCAKTARVQICGIEPYNTSKDHPTILSSTKNLRLSASFSAAICVNPFFSLSHQLPCPAIRQPPDPSKHEASKHRIRIGFLRHQPLLHSLRFVVFLCLQPKERPQKEDTANEQFVQQPAHGKRAQADEQKLA